MYKMRDTSKLLSYQTRGVEALCSHVISNGAALDGTDTGLGKSYTSLAVCRELNLRPGIICKKAGFGAWSKALRHFKIRPLFILNWERAKTGGTPYAKIINGENPVYKWIIPPKTLLIFDEAHSANNLGTLNNRLYIASKKIPSLALSATFADKPSKMYTFIRMVNAMDHNQFLQWLNDRGQFTNRNNSPESLTSADDLIEIHKLLFPGYGYRLSYTDPDVKGLFPEGVYQTKLISLSPKQTSEQNALYKSMILKAEKLRELGKQAEAMVADLRYRQRTELLKAEPIKELLSEYLNENKSVCVFVNFRDTLNYLSKTLKTNSLIYGGQKEHERSKILKNFQSNKVPVIICMVDAGGQSIDLHDTLGTRPRISLICPTYNPITLKQVLGRTYRAGSKSTPIMQLIYASKTIEEKVAESVNEKLANISALTDGDLMEPDLFKLVSKKGDK